MKTTKKIIVKAFDFITVCAILGLLFSICGMTNAWKITFEPCITFIASALWIGFYTYLYKLSNR